jgi:hypothetical protein
VIPVAAGLAIIVIWIVRPFDTDVESAAMSIVLVGAPFLALVAYWLVSDIPTAAVFDLARRRDIKPATVRKCKPNTQFDQ